ncbi:MAG: alpha-glucan family phosphorylase, partial [Rhodospirillaceae bacterium]
MAPIDPFLQRTRIAYFSMEIALRREIHTYSGGLGVLAGDTARSCADLELPMVFVSLISRKGYLLQTFDSEGRQQDSADPWDPATWTTALNAMVAVTIGEREVWIRPWLLTFPSASAFSAPVLLLDTDLEQNHPDDRGITDHLYGGEPEYRLKQNIVLGIGGVLILQALGFRIALYHMNEGHAALLAVQLLHQFRRPATGLAPGESSYDPARVREMCTFTTHTPIGATSEVFSYDLVARLLGAYMENGELKALGGAEGLNLTLLALNLSAYINGVAQRHAETTRHMFPAYHVHAITNGVHPATWTHPAFAKIYDLHFPRWRHEPEMLAHADQLDDEVIWTAHQNAKQSLCDMVKHRCGVALRADLPIISFARRMTGYKRPDLLFTDIPRLVAIARKQPFQIVMAGKAHPRDQEGKRLIAQLNQHVR